MNLSNLSDILSRSYGLASNDPYRLPNIGFNAAERGANALGIDGNLRQPSSSLVRLSDYGKLQSALSRLKGSLGGIDTADEAATVSGVSDNKLITASVDKSSALPKSAAIEVGQKAESQRLQSQTFIDRDSTIIGTGSITIEQGRFNSGTNSFTASAKPATTISISAGNGTLSGIANEINRANAGVSAKVVQDGSNFRLEVTGKDTGTEQAFRIRVSDSDNNNTDNAQGLSRLAFDPTEVPGTGRNQTQLRAAQDAELTVDGRAFVSGSNQVKGAVNGATLNIEATGSARIDFKRDVVQASGSAKRLAETLNDFRAQAGSLQSDGLSRRISSDIDRAFSGAETGQGRDRLTLAQVGIETASDGRVTVDDARFKRAFEANPDGVASLLGNAADRIETAGNAALNGQLRTTTASLRASTQADGNSAQARQSQLQSLFGNQTSLLSYSPTTRNLYGLAQYLAVAGF
ncbi:hypothetical protein FNU76_17310 [Chitinimonas arctica]|uniref:Flagellar hook-associated protein 2 C-terminal domain-containing protein n=1 Tax=Chitinimonas arctica TaxID=2594795 RepID=A0A516SIH8_9NEIS|nr:flagellar filament capping protein FliD [Chitinimonas arctica]QDQ27959.1 hypothetical protein FNU76_17310 [Chitinimonas arctica]